VLGVRRRGFIWLWCWSVGWLVVCQHNSNMAVSHSPIGVHTHKQMHHDSCLTPPTHSPPLFYTHSERVIDMFWWDWLSRFHRSKEMVALSFSLIQQRFFNRPTKVEYLHPTPCLHVFVFVCVLLLRMLNLMYHPQVKNYILITLTVFKDLPVQWSVFIGLSEYFKY